MEILHRFPVGSGIVHTSYNQYVRIVDGEYGFPLWNVSRAMLNYQMHSYVQLYWSLGNPHIDHNSYAKPKFKDQTQLMSRS